MIWRQGTGWRLHCGDSKDMGVLESGSVPLVLTGPPYFLAGTEVKLKMPRASQTFVNEVRREVASYALSLAPHFGEMGRVCRPGGYLVIHTKDIRYGHTLVPLAEFHRQAGEAAGFLMTNRVLWRRKPLLRSRSRTFSRNFTAAPFEVDDLDEFLVLQKPGRSVIRREPLESARVQDLAEPVWTFPALGNLRTHPHQSPHEAIRRFVTLLSEPGDVVLDPFAGHATTMRAALSQGRQAIGWELDSKNYERSIQFLEALAK